MDEETEEDLRCDRSIFSFVNKVMRALQVPIRNRFCLSSGKSDTTSSNCSNGRRERIKEQRSEVNGHIEEMNLTCSKTLATSDGENDRPRGQKNWSLLDEDEEEKPNKICEAEAIQMFQTSCSCGCGCCCKDSAYWRS